MDSWISRNKRRRISLPQKNIPPAAPTPPPPQDESESTDFKLALLASLYPLLDHGILLEALLAHEGSVDEATDALRSTVPVTTPRKRSAPADQQAALSAFNIGVSNSMRTSKQLTQKGKTLHLYAPKDIETHTPCSIIHNFLPAEEAEALLRELLGEVPSFTPQTFKLFDREVQSPHTMCFYVESVGEAEKQKTEFVYNGSYIEDVRSILPEMRKVSAKVKMAVNAEIQRRISEFYPGAKKLKYQSPEEWCPNAAFVNCYDGGAESVGYHSDQLTYLGPRAVIGSLSLGVAREFRVRKIVAQDDDSDTKAASSTRADAQGQISIHLPHNSLLVMHAEMQEEWKHSIAPAPSIVPHPLAGNKRINITYRCYKESLHPKFTPKCKCGIPTVLRCVQRKKENRGKYMWQCHASYTPGQAGCDFFKWAEFDNDGEPPWGRKAESKEEIFEKDAGLN